VRFIATQLVDIPQRIRSRTVELEDGQKIILTVDKDDRGKLIGQGGRTARALRAIVRAAGAAHDARYQIEITD